MEEQKEKIYELLSKNFVYKAEWLESDMFNLFTKPSYFPEIIGIESCVLIGGRGTGKTTVLKGLSYKGLFAQNTKSETDPNYYGLYYKVESNRVNVFTGLAKSDAEWVKPFSHYINLIILSLTSDLLLWLEERGVLNQQEIGGYKWELLQNEMGWPLITGFTHLKSLIQQEISFFEKFINNNVNDKTYNLTVLGSSIDILFDAIIDLKALSGRRIFLLIDEYENFSRYQQEVVNTLIKQASGKGYSFKVGVRELGWKSRTTLNGQELRSPSDYRKIEIQTALEQEFENFATDVCESRLNVVFQSLNIEAKAVIKNIFPALSVESESEILGIVGLVEASQKGRKIAQSLPDLHPLYIWFLTNWNTNQDKTPHSIVQDYKKNVSAWNTRYDNYKYAILFTIKKQKAGLRKHYCGWSTLVLMAGANIRFMLQLVEACLKFHVDSDGVIGQPINATNQTKGATKVGQSNFEELEGLDVNGDAIMQLLQGIGRVFEILARDPFGHAPEINQLYIKDLHDRHMITTKSKKANIQQLLDSSISHLALRRNISTKLAQDSPRSFDYSIHPIYSALFKISHRRKRKLVLLNRDIEGLIFNQRLTIEGIIGKHNRVNVELLEGDDTLSQLNKIKPNSSGQLDLFF